MEHLKDQFYYIYLQPIALCAGSRQGGHAFMGQNQLQLLGSNMQSPKVGRAPLKIRDLIRFNKDYKVYNNTIHFYNFLYVVEINKNAYPLLTHEIISIKLTTKNNNSQWTSRRFTVPLPTIYRGLQNNEILIETQNFNCESQGDRSQLAINIVKSRASMTMRGLEQLLEQKDDAIFESPSKHNISQEYKIQIKEPQNNQMFGNFIPSTLLQDSVIKFDKLESVQTTHLNENNEQLTQEGSFLKQQQRPNYVKRRRGSTNSSKSNTAFYDESPKLKRIYRLRRSEITPASVCSDLEEEDLTKTFEDAKSKCSRYLVNFLLLLSLGVIYALMHPRVRC